ncbi:MAG: endo-1,4-beta-xylanase [Alphaproteobacteria bacterium]|nr:endo-1,4-beta-xylanase [Alphaproteobacteria bacterium]
MLTRRSLLSGAAAGVLTPKTKAAVEDLPLRQRAAKSGRSYGCAAGSYQLRDTDFAPVLAREAGVLVPEYELKRLIVEPTPGHFDFSGADVLIAFAAAHGMTMRGHTLVWYAANPDWLEAAVLAAPDEDILTGYVTGMVQRYRGRIQSWDIVNEAIQPDDGRPDGLRDCFWLKRYGPSYIDHAYFAARQADLTAQLVYNDWGCEGGEAWNDRFRATTLKFLEGALARKVPIDALGLQGHLAAFHGSVNQRKLRAFLDEVRAMGLKILVTEHDVDDSGGPSDIAVRDRAVADASARFFDVVLDNTAATDVLTWGLTDRYLKAPGGLRSMLSGYTPRKLPLDANLKRKPMWYAMSQALAAEHGIR